MARAAAPTTRFGTGQGRGLARGDGRARGGLRLRRPLLALIPIGWLLVAGIGLHGYWESYYQHRGFAPVARLPRAGVGSRLTVRFYSPALGREADYRVVLPPGYDPAQHRYPVFYLLHGSPGRPQVFEAIAHLDVRLENLISQHRMQAMILVFPDGRIGGSTYSDSEWANTPAGDFESYVLDVVRDVDSRFATVANRQDRVIAGFSAGGYGAANVALHGVIGRARPATRCGRFCSSAIRIAGAARSPRWPPR